LADKEFVAWLKTSKGVCGWDIRNKATPRGPAKAPNEERPTNSCAVVASL
jgi:hypothetical protein